MSFLQTINKFLHGGSQQAVKERKREILIILILIGGAVLFKVALLVINNTIGNQSSTNITNLPVQSGHVTVTMSQRAYHANIIVITVGTTVTWTNRDPMDHTVTQGKGAAATPHGFNSGVMTSGQSWSYTFTTPGTYQYTCLFHPDMNGQVVVKKT